MNKTTVYDGLVFVCIVVIFIVSMCRYNNEYMKMNDYNTLISNIKSYINQLDYVNILLVDDQMDTFENHYLDVFGVKNNKTLTKLRVYFDGNMDIEGHTFMNEEISDDSLYEFNNLNTNIY